MAVGRLPESGADLCSQPTISRLENLPGRVALIRMMAAMVELFCDSFASVPRRIVLDLACPPAREAGPGGRHRGPRPRCAATLAVQRLLRQPLLPADPHLRGPDGQAGPRHPAPRTEPGQHGGRPPAAPCRSCPPGATPQGRQESPRVGTEGVD